MVTALEHWEKVYEDHGLLVEFMRWLESGRAMPSGAQVALQRLPPTPTAMMVRDSQEDMSFERLADRFFEVDRKALEKERRELLDSVRNKYICSRSIEGILNE